MPGDPRKAQSEGSNSLIRQGAALVTNVQDILNGLGGPLRQTSGEEGREGTESLPRPSLSAEERRVFEGLGREALHVDELAEKLDMDVSQLLGILLRLMMKQLVREHPGKLYSLG